MEITPLSTNTYSQEISVGLEEHLPAGKTILYALQHVLVSNAWLDPLFVGAMIGLPAAMAGNMVNAIFIAAGVVTLTQATRLARLPIVQGPSAAFDTLMITAGKTGGLSAAGGGIVISGIIVFLLAITGLLQRMRAIFTPVVSGSVIVIVGLALSSFTMFEFLGGASGMSSFLSASSLMMSIVTSAVVVLLTTFGRGFLRSYAFLVALVIGDVVAAMLHKISFAPVTEKPWFGFPHVLPYGHLTFTGSAFATFFVAYIVAVIEAFGVYSAATDMVNIPLDNRRIKFGFAGEAAGSILSTFIGGFPTTAYAQNVGLLRLTGVASRFPVAIAGVLFLVLGLVPKAGALLAATPDPVVGGIFLPAAATLVFSGISILAKMEKTNVNYMIAGLSILLAVALPGAITGVHGFAGQFLGNTTLVGACTAIVLQILLVQVPRWLGFRAN